MGGVSHPGMNALLSSRALKPLTSALPLHTLPTLRPSTERVCCDAPSGMRAPVASAARSSDSGSESGRLGSGGGAVNRVVGYSIGPRSS